MRWLNLPEYLLERWSGTAVAEYTNATHTALVDLATRSWSDEILKAVKLDQRTMAKIVPPGTVLGTMRGPLAALPALHSAAIIAPSCHDTASAIHGIAARGDRWGYISCGTWSLVGRPMHRALDQGASCDDGFTNLGLDAQRYMVQKNLNGMWLLKQCMTEWAEEGKPWDIEELIAAAAVEPAPTVRLNVDDPGLQRMHHMPKRIDAQLVARGLPPLDAASAAAPAMTSLILHSLAARYAEVFRSLEQSTGESIDRIYVVGGGSRNHLLLQLTAQASGIEVIAGSAESSTIGNFALQLAALDAHGAVPARETIAHYAEMLCAVSQSQA